MSMSLAKRFVALSAVLAVAGCGQSKPIPPTVQGLLHSRHRPHNLDVVLITDDWTVWTTRDVDPRTRSHRAPTCTFHHVLQRRGETNVTAAPFQYRDTRAMWPIWVFDDGSLVLYQPYPCSIFVVKSGGIVHTNWIHGIHLNASDNDPSALVAGAAGVVMQPCTLNGSEDGCKCSWTVIRTPHVVQ